MNKEIAKPTASEQAANLLKMIEVIRFDVSSCVTLAREATEESVLPDGCYTRALNLYSNLLGLLAKTNAMVEAMQPEIEAIAGLEAQSLRDISGATCH